MNRLTDNIAASNFNEMRPIKTSQRLYFCLYPSKNNSSSCVKANCDFEILRETLNLKAFYGSPLELRKFCEQWQQRK